MSDANKREPTHRGPVFDAAVERLSRRRDRPDGADDAVVRENLDVEHYLMRSPFLAEEVLRDPLRAFYRNDVENDRSPHENFSPKAYAERYPALAHLDSRDLYLHWLQHGRDNGEVAEPTHGVEKMAPILGKTEEELVTDLQEIRTDLLHRLRHGRLGEMMAKAAEIEPLIGGAFVKTFTPKIMPVGKPIGTDQVAAMYAAHEQAEFRRARLVIVVNRPRWGGGRRLEGHIAHAIGQSVAASEIVVVYTDDGGESRADRYPEGVREIFFRDIVVREGLEPSGRQRVLVEFLRSLHADAIVSVNSKMLYEAMRTYGKALHATERIYLVLFCNDQGPLGNWDGWPLRAFYRYWDLLAGVITDSHYLKDWLVDHHQMFEGEAERIHVFSAPVDPTIPVAQAPELIDGRRSQVVWAGRWDRQKRIDLVFAIAAAMPDVDFQLWCDSDAGNSELTGEPPSNVTLLPPYSKVSELDLSDADVWLYTSGWDGVPSQLLEVAMTGVPLVGTLVGGTGEVLAPEESKPVAGDDPADYVQGLREVLADPAGARSRARSLRDRLIAERTPEVYAQQCEALLNSGGW